MLMSSSKTVIVELHFDQVTSAKEVWSDKKEVKVFPGKFALRRKVLIGVALYIHNYFDKCPFIWFIDALDSKDCPAIKEKRVL